MTFQCTLLYIIFRLTFVISKTNFFLLNSDSQDSFVLVLDTFTNLHENKRNAEIFWFTAFGILCWHVCNFFLHIKTCMQFFKIYSVLQILLYQEGKLNILNKSWLNFCWYFRFVGYQFYEREKQWSKLYVKYVRTSG